MNGMKEGAGDDPFDSDSDQDISASLREDPPSTPSDAPEQSSTSSTGSSQQSAGESIKLPYIYRRSGVKDDRERITYFLQDETIDAERQAHRVFEDRFDQEVLETDLREALVLAGLDNLGEVQTHLEEWGYGLESE